jgi:hypothetical protein
MHDDRITYPPLNTLKAIAENVWIVDGPAIGFGPPGLKMRFPTRMTVIRIGGDLFLHSPTMLTPSLGFEAARLGTPRWIAGPSRIHYWWIPDWHAAFPAAEVYLAPKIREQAKGRIDFPARELDGKDGYPWDDAIATLPVEGSYMTEVVFFHRPSRTLVLTDLIENFEPQKLGWFARWLTRLGGANGSMPRDMRMSYRNKAALKTAVVTMIGWDPARVVLAHGRWYERDGAKELKRAFSWLLD